MRKGGDNSNKIHDIREWAYNFIKENKATLSEADEKNLSQLSSSDKLSLIAQTIDRIIAEGENAEVKKSTTLLNLISSSHYQEIKQYAARKIINEETVFSLSTEETKELLKHIPEAGKEMVDIGINNLKSDDEKTLYCQDILSNSALHKIMKKHAALYFVNIEINKNNNAFEASAKAEKLLETSPYPEVQQYAARTIVEIAANNFGKIRKRTYTEETEADDKFVNNKDLFTLLEHSNINVRQYAAAKIINHRTISLMDERSLVEFFEKLVELATKQNQNSILDPHATATKLAKEIQEKQVNGRISRCLNTKAKEYAYNKADIELQLATKQSQLDKFTHLNSFVSLNGIDKNLQTYIVTKMGDIALANINNQKITFPFLGLLTHNNAYVKQAAVNTILKTGIIRQISPINQRDVLKCTAEIISSSPDTTWLNIAAVRKEVIPFLKSEFATNAINIICKKRVLAQMSDDETITFIRAVSYKINGNATLKNLFTQEAKKLQGFLELEMELKKHDRIPFLDQLLETSETQETTNFAASRIVNIYIDNNDHKLQYQNIIDLLNDNNINIRRAAQKEILNEKMISKMSDEQIDEYLHEIAQLRHYRKEIKDTVLPLLSESNNEKVRQIAARVILNQHIIAVIGNQNVMQSIMLLADITLNTAQTNMFSYAYAIKELSDLRHKSNSEKIKEYALCAIMEIELKHCKLPEEQIAFLLETLKSQDIDARNEDDAISNLLNIMYEEQNYDFLIDLLKHPNANLRYRITESIIIDKLLFSMSQKQQQKATREIKNIMTTEGIDEPFLTDIETVKILSQFLLFNSDLEIKQNIISILLSDPLSSAMEQINSALVEVEKEKVSKLPVKSILEQEEKERLENIIEKLAIKTSQSTLELSNMSQEDLAEIGEILLLSDSKSNATPNIESENPQENKEQPSKRENTLRNVDINSPSRKNKPIKKQRKQEEESLFSPISDKENHNDEQKTLPLRAQRSPSLEEQSNNNDRLKRSRDSLKENAPSSFTFISSQLELLRRESRFGMASQRSY